VEVICKINIFELLEQYFPNFVFNDVAERLNPMDGNIILGISCLADFFYLSLSAHQMIEQSYVFLSFLHVPWLDPTHHGKVALTSL